MKYDFFIKRFVENEIDATKIAIAGSDSDISWHLLQTGVNQLTEVFKKLNIPAGHPVIIYGHKESFFPLSILACIHAGITYIPIDKIYPLDRIKKIKETVGSQVLINCSDDLLKIDFSIVINKNLEVKINSTPDFTDNIYPVQNDILQYIMFTSGSTGEPKGVQITDSSVNAFVKWAMNDFGLTSDVVIMSQALFIFDLSLWDILIVFSHGGTLVLISTDMLKEQETVISRIAEYKCNLWTSTPSFVFLFLRNVDFNFERLPYLNSFYLMGEELPSRTAGKLKLLFNNAKVINAYGPTETTIITTLVEITEKIINQYPSLPIGYPMPRSEVLIDKKKHEDKEGELVIVGNHVSIGYFKNEKFNKQKFFMHNGRRAFKTGDIGYYKDGMLFYSGRNDEQVKMHGFRIELNEINNEICKSALIAEAVTVPLKNGNQVKKIVSFVIVKLPVENDEIKKQLLSFLSKTLPYYMIPGDIIVIKNFPYNTNHKIDKNKLINDYISLQTS